MILSFHPCFVTDRQIILGDRALGEDDRRLIRDADAILLPQACSSELFDACRQSRAALFPNYTSRFEFPGKIGQSELFKRFEWPHPNTTVWGTVDHFRKACPGPEDFPHDRPFLIKTNHGHEAEGIFVIHDLQDLEASCASLSALEHTGYHGFVSQEMIASRGNVLRVVILGRRFISYWKRPKRPGRMITTISRGAIIDRHWRPDLQGKGISAARRLSADTGINLAAVDFIFSLDRPDPGPLVLEINYYFGRRGLGGSLKYYRSLYRVIQEWLAEQGRDSGKVTLA
ncbi:MAG: ATP-grasp domain-containing protein [Desulfatiglandales bacterium]